MDSKIDIGKMSKIDGINLERDSGLERSVFSKVFQEDGGKSKEDGGKSKDGEDCVEKEYLVKVEAGPVNPLGQVRIPYGLCALSRKQLFLEILKTLQQAFVNLASGQITKK